MIEYALAYQFKRKGHWYISDKRFNSLKDAKNDLSVQSNLQIHGPHWAKNWKIVARNVSEWKDVNYEAN